MYLQRSQLGRLVIHDVLETVLFNFSPQQYPETRNVFLVNLQNGAFQPACAKTHARASLAHVLVGSTHVQCLLEQRDARLVPQPLAKNNRRVGTYRHDRCCQRLRYIVLVHKFLRSHLQVYLKTRVAGLQQRGIVLHQQFVNAGES